MKKHDLLLALNGIIAAASDSDAAGIMLERTEALHKRVKAEAEPLEPVLAVVEQMVDPDEIQHLIAGATQIYFGVPTIPRPDEILVTVTITEGHNDS